MRVQPYDGELRAVGQSKLVQYHADSIADSAFAQKQFGGDVAVIKPLGNEHGDFTFAVVQKFGSGIVGISGIAGICRIRSPFGEFAEDFRTEHHLTGHDRLQAGPTAATSCLMR